jgi:uncharacterized damage-inducible protein DinB
MSLRTHFVMMGQFHRWATRRILASLGALDDPMFRPIRQAMVPVVFSTHGDNARSSSPRDAALLQVGGGVTEDQLDAEHPYLRDLNLPCGSIHGTLCHLYYADQLWFMRLTEQSVPPELSQMWLANDSTSVWSNHFTSQQTGVPVSAGTAAAAKATPLTRPVPVSARPLPFNASADLLSPAGLAADTADAVAAVTGTAPYSVAVAALSVVPLELSPEVAMGAQKARHAIGMRLDDQNSDWLDLLKGLPEPAFGEKISYTDTAGVKYSRTRMALLTHVFNHATWHRGQVSSALAQLGVPVPVLDLTAFMPEWEELHAKAFRWA